MRTLLGFKIADLTLQFLALTVSVIYVAQGNNILFIYLSVCAIQVLSCLANIFLNHKLRLPGRRYYEWAMLVIGLLLLICYLLNSDVLGLILIALLFVGPLMGIWYAIITNEEARIIRGYVNRKKYILTN